MGSNIKSLLVLFGFSMLAVGAYVALEKYDVFSSTEEMIKRIEKNTIDLESALLEKQKKIEDIQFDDGIVAREDYISLKDLSIQLPQPRLSRPNPFANLP